VSRILPPFAAIRAFEATARLGSLLAASEEICVTTSAVSHQIRNLEDFTGRTLFDRRASGLHLTDDGERYLDQVSAVLRKLEASTRELMDGSVCGSLRVRSTPGFAYRWLLPRLDSFAAEWPEIDLELSTGMPPSEFVAAECDVLIHWGAQPLPGAVVTPFFSTRRFCVASPALFRHRPRPRRVCDLANFTLLHDKYGDGWDDYMASVGGVDFDYTSGPRFEHCDLALAAVEAGQGIAIAYALISDLLLREGKIERILPFEIGPYLIHSLAVSADRQQDARVTAFTDWLLGEAGKQERAAEAIPHPASIGS
jgi:LysR family glycine cleavage system transcriptional activator